MNIDRLFRVLVVGGSLLAAGCSHHYAKPDSEPATKPATKPEGDPQPKDGDDTNKEPPKEADTAKDGQCSWL